MFLPIWHGVTGPLYQVSQCAVNWHVCSVAPQLAKCATVSENLKNCLECWRRISISGKPPRFSLSFGQFYSEREWQAYLKSTVDVVRLGSNEHDKFSRASAAYLGTEPFLNIVYVYVMCSISQLTNKTWTKTNVIIKVNIILNLATIHVLHFVFRGNVSEY